MKPADLFHKATPGEQAASDYLADHVVHDEREREYLAFGWIMKANAEHEAARIALRAYNAEKLEMRD